MDDPENDLLTLIMLLFLTNEIASVPFLVLTIDYSEVEFSFLGGTASSKIQFSNRLTWSHCIDFRTVGFPLDKFVTNKVVVPFQVINLVASSLKFDTTVFIRCFIMNPIN